MKKFGTSISVCILDIVRGEVALEDVAFLLSPQPVISRDILFDMLATTFTVKHLSRAQEVASTLWDTGRIFSATLAVADRETQRRWVSLPAIFSR